MDNFIAKYLQRIKAAQNDDELAAIIDEIYLDGFQDGAAEGETK